MRRKTLIVIPAFKRLGYFHVVPTGTWWNAAAASTRAINGPRKPVKNLFFRGCKARTLPLSTEERPRDSPRGRGGVISSGPNDC